MPAVNEMTERVPGRAFQLSLLRGNPLLRFWGFEPDAVRYAKDWTSATPKQRRFADGLGAFLNSDVTMLTSAFGVLMGGNLLVIAGLEFLLSLDVLFPLSETLVPQFLCSALTFVGMTTLVARLFVAPLRQPKWLPGDVELEGFAEAVLAEMGPEDARTFLVACRDREHAEVPRGGECQEFLTRMDEVLNGLRARRNSESVR